MPEPHPASSTAAPRWGRRGVLRLAAALPLAALAACSDRDETGSRQPGGAAATSSAAPAVPPFPPSTPIPTALPAPVTLAVDLLPPTLGRGETMRVRVPLPVWATDAHGAARLNGRDYPLSRLPDGSLWGVVGAALDATTTASTPLAVAVLTPDGRTIGIGEAQTAIVAVERAVERLYVTEEQGAVLGGDAGPREVAIRTAQFSASDLAPPRWAGLFQRPTSGPITTDFGGARAINDGPPGPGHTGTDFAEDEGVPVRLAAPGRVAWAGAMPIRGNSVLLDHGAGVKSGYHHLSAIAVEVGEVILPAGTILGAVGATGFATGPHLHWEITVWGVNVDAMTWLRVPFHA